MQAPIATILIQPVDLSQQRIIECLQMEIILYPEYVIYAVNFYADEPVDGDAGMPWQQCYTDSQWMIKREALTSIEKTWLRDTEVWKIDLSVSGCNTDLKLYFKKESDCDKVYKTLIDYIWPNL